jgi:N-acetylglucosaminyldiphosphoundecaprenol N-acetyl-beta-D-mannosaminyltransferase
MASTQLARADPETVDLMGLGFAMLSERSTIEHVLDELSRGRGGWICTANVDILRQWARSPEIRALIADANLIVADGMPLLWASTLQGTPLPERVAGSTLISSLTAAAALQGASVFLLGGNPGTADEAARRLALSNPGLRVAGTLCPPFGFEQQSDYLDLIASTLLAADPDIVYVGLGFPKQERLISWLRELLPNAWFVGCGVGFSFIAGEMTRAPRFFQRVGLEWCFRLAQEPRRLGRRYVLDGIPFALAMMSRALSRRASAARQRTRSATTRRA